jgi:predicted RNase H-like nuclease (RuvC/YqgF family)
VTNNDSDRISKDELRDMYNSYTKCNFSASSIMTDIQRLQLKYERGLRCIYNGVSLRGVIIGIKKKSGNQEKEKEPEADISNSGFADYGYDEVNYEYHTEQLQKELREKNKQYTELQIEHDQLKADFEELKKKMEAMATKPLK